MKKIKAKDLTCSYQIKINKKFHSIASVVNYFDEYVEIFLGQYGSDGYTCDGNEKVTVRRNKKCSK